jgi:dimethylaniline monooxygenase (N-oxide forming)
MRKYASNNDNTDGSELSKNALVIGAGASGLVAAKYLLASTNPTTYQVTILEQSHEIGGSFVNKVYDNARLVSSKYITAFSDFRMSEDAAVCPNHPSAQQYVDYLKSYCETFSLEKCIQFGCTVVSIKDAAAGAGTTRSDDDDDDDDSMGYTVQYQNADGQLITRHFDVVSVCSGLHNTPNIPQEFDDPSKNPNSLTRKFKGQIIHSSQYTESSIFTNQRVLVLGSGETAMDIAHRAIQNPHSQTVALCVRRGFLSIPHNLAEDRPLDVFITNLFEHAYEHPWVHALRLRWVLSTVFIRVFLLITGSSFGFNQWAVPTTPIRRGYHIINKSHAAMGHLNVPIKRKTVWGRFWMWAYGETNLRPMESFHKTQVVDVEGDGVTVRFEDGRTYEADLIVMATGYKQSFPFLDDTIRKDFQRESLEAKSGPAAPGGEAKCKYALDEDYLPTEHFIVSKSRPRLGFIGFVRPNVGAIPPMSELQAMWWLQRMAGKTNMLPAKAGPPSYMVLGAKYQYGVDYGNYMHRVAEDIGAAPTLSTLAKSNQPLKALYTYCIGQSMVPLFRLEGPYASKFCGEVVTGELWRVCMRRGLAENVGLIYMTYLSLLMNMAACALECVWCLLTLRKPKFFVRY